MKRALVTCRQMQDYLTGLTLPDLTFESPTLHGQAFSSNEMERISKGHEYLIAGDDELDSEFFRHSETLRLVIRWGVGMDNVDLEAARSRGVTVWNTPGVFNDDVAQLALAYMLMLSRHIREVDQSVREGAWTKIQGNSVSKKVVAIMGFGGIGQKLADYCHALDMKVTFYDPFKESDSKHYVKASSLEELVSGSDYLVLTAPLTASTRLAVDADLIAHASQNLRIVNVSRGGLVDEAAVSAALAAGKLGGFASDVFITEPLTDASPLLHAPNTIFGSHNASNTAEGVLRASEESLRKLRAFIQSDSRMTAPEE